MKKEAKFWQPVIEKAMRNNGFVAGDNPNKCEVEKFLDTVMALGMMQLDGRLFMLKSLICDNSQLYEDIVVVVAGENDE